MGILLLETSARWNPAPPGQKPNPGQTDFNFMATIIYKTWNTA